jgi:hypothetical protein
MLEAGLYIYIYIYILDSRGLPRLHVYCDIIGDCSCIAYVIRTIGDQFETSCGIQRKIDV